MTLPSSERRCGSCGELVLPRRTLRTDKHYADERCPRCEFFMGFVPKPESDKAKRPNAQRDLVKKYGVDYCEICSLGKVELPPGDALEGHHIVELKDGGEASEVNTLTVCSHCHLLIHFQRDHYAKTIREVRAKERGE